MKISELIQELETIQNQDGDIKIQTVDPNDFYQSVPVSNVTESCFIFLVGGHSMALRLSSTRAGKPPLNFFKRIRQSSADLQKMKLLNYPNVSRNN